MILIQKLKELFPELQTYKQLEMELYKEDRSFVIERLLSVPELKAHFFYEASGCLVFDAQKLMDFIRQREVFASSYTKYKNKITLASGGKSIAKELGHVVLNFPFKECILEGGMSTEDKKRSEIFYNETLAPEEITRLFEPKALTNFQSYGNRTGEINHEKDNLLIKGNNLLALYSLLPKYRGKVKLIYIDPPYNTGNDGFKYNDAFNHSTWLVFMKNRLEVARQLLSDDGVIFVQIDDNEQAYLKVLMDEVFGRENFVSNVIWEKKFSPQNDAKWLSDNHDFIMIFGKIKSSWEINLLPRTEEMNARYKNLDNDPRGDWTSGALQVKTYSAIYDYPITTPGGREVWAGNGSCWRFSKEKLQDLIKDNRIWFGENGDSVPRLKRFLSEVKDGLVPLTLWKHSEVGHNQQAKQDIGKMDLNFSSPKPEALLERIIQIATKEGDLVLDFFAGSGTTPAVAHKMGRRWITIEQMDYVETITRVRLQKVLDGEQGGISKNHKWQGGGGFCYFELFEWNKKFADAICGVESMEELMRVYGEIKGQAFWRYDLEENDAEFKALTLDEQKQLMVEMLNKNHLYCNIGEIEDATYKISKEDLEFNKEFYE